MDNVIKITLDDKQATRRHRIEFESNPTISELCAAVLVLEEALEHNFGKEEILRFKALTYPKLSDLEEVYNEKGENNESISEKHIN